MSEQEQPSWVAVISRPAAEEVAERSLRQAGYRVYLPRYRKVIRGTRVDVRGRRVRPRGEIVMRPLFPSYLFADIDCVSQWSSLKRANGIADLIWRGEVAAELPGSVIDGIRAAEQSGVFDEERPGCKSKRKDLPIGAQVRVLDGPFSSFLGILSGLDETGRATALLNIFGRDTPIGIDQHALEVVAS